MRAAYVMWKATPPNDRPPEIATLELFMKMFKVSMSEVAAVECEPGFDEAVMRSDSHWKHGVHAIIGAIKLRALSPDKEQLRYATAYMRLVGDERADRIESLVQD